MNSFGRPLNHIVLLLLFLVLAGCGGEQGGKKIALPNEGDPAPLLKLVTFSGADIDIADFKGSPVVINFWASWCKPCKHEAEALEKTYRVFKKAGVEFVGVAVQDKDKNSLAFIKEYGITYPNGPDHTGVLSATYKIYGIPRTFVVDREGRFAFIHTGAITGKVLGAEIEKVL